MTAKMFLTFNFVLILPWYLKKRDPRSFPGTIAVKELNNSRQAFSNLT